VKKMKKLIPIALAGAIAMLIGAAAFADDMGMGKMTEEKMMKKQTEKVEMMTKTLSLTPDQKDKVAAILKANGEQKKAMMMKMEADEKTMKEAQDTQIKAILTPDQQAKFDKMVADQKAKWQKKDKDKKGM